MRILLNPEPNLGDTRFVGRFLWLPYRIGNERRWFEYAVYQQIYIEEYCGGPLPSAFVWKSIAWIDDEYFIQYYKQL